MRKIALKKKLFTVLFYLSNAPPEGTARSADPDRKIEKEE